MSYGRGFWEGIRLLVYAYRKCDDSEHVECKNGHEVLSLRMAMDDDWDNAMLPTAELDECPTCGAQIYVRVEKSLMLRLATQQIKASVAPYRLIEFDPDKPEVTETTYWRGRVIRERLIKNTLRIDAQ